MLYYGMLKWFWCRQDASVGRLQIPPVSHPVTHQPET
jgi:hypothetical protein